MLSIVIPVHNEEHSILPLYDRLTAVLESLGQAYEIIFVDDASTDRSFELLANLVETDPRLTVVRLRRNFGQTAALSAGFHEAKGEVVIAMDGDLQHAPEDIPALLEKIDQGFDIASGWRKRRVDNAIMRKIPSRIANWLMAKASGIELHDFGTTFKAYRAAGRGRFALWNQPHVPRDVRHPDDQVHAEVLHPADALLRHAGFDRHRLRRLHSAVPAREEAARV